MKKKVLVAIIIVITVILLVMIINNGKKSDGQVQSNSNNVEIENEKFQIFYLNVDITPGEVFNAESIPEERSLSQIVSCAFEGTDNVSTYNHVEIISAQIEENERVYSVYFLDDEIQTQEGVKITDNKEKVIEKYGDNYEENGNKIIYQKGNVELSFIIENDIVTAIEYIYDI